MKRLLRLTVALAVAAAMLVFTASCEMLPPELQETINGLIGGSNEPEGCTHENVEWVVDMEATCKYEGTQHSVCTSCFETVEANVKIDKSNEHTLGEWEIEFEPNCVKPGSRFKKCSVCKNKVVVEDIPIVSTHRYQYGTCRDCGEAQTESIGLVYTSNGDGTCSVSGIGTCKDTSIVIPATSPAGDRVTYISENAFYGASQITSVIVADSVTGAAASAFKECNITMATAPAAILPALKLGKLAGLTVTGSGKIPDYALGGASSLSTLIISEGVTEVGDAAFSGCPSLRSIDMPASLVTIGKSAFSKCMALTTITIGSGVVTIGDYAFEGSKYITEVYIPASVKYIGASAFNSPRLEKVVFELTEGWYAASTATATTGSAIPPAEIADEKGVCELLNKTYVKYYIKRT